VEGNWIPGGGRSFSGSGIIVSVAVLRRHIPHAMLQLFLRAMGSPNRGNGVGQ
jgi:hypothetical protein